MPTFTDDAICIRHWDFSETSQTVSLFTREHGIVRGLAKGAKRVKGAFSGGIELLTRGQVVVIVKPGRELATLTEWSLSDGYRSLRESLASSRIGFYLADLIHRLLTDHDPHSTLFDELCMALASLRDMAESPVALLRFQWSILQETGYQPVLDQDASSGKPLPASAALAFDPGAGGVVTYRTGSRAWRVRGQTVELLRQLQAAPDSISAVSESIDRANRLLAAYLREIIGEEPPTLRWVFPDLSR